uniref:Ionotropic glutamate receptor C-terminal domain-containing protein n=1 Tax=Chenopodium quinoa TaxID=63459 RepID=A0A803KNY5_CHEQI
MKNSGKYLLVLLFTMSLIAIHVTGQNSTGLTNQTDTTRKLRFLVPKRDLEDFVKVRKLSNESFIISGFSVEVFWAAAKIAIPSREIDLVPFTDSDGTTMRGTFDDMLQAIDNEFAGLRWCGGGDNNSPRMQWVDFTLPYLDTEIGLLVRLRIGFGSYVHISMQHLRHNSQVTNLIELESEVEMLYKLQKGGEDGGIDTVVADTAHLKLFQEKHCDEFTLVQDFRVKSAGLGFAFHRDQSPSFVNLFSEAIVKLIDYGNMTEIQEATLGDLDKICQDTTGATGGFRFTVQDRISIWLPVTSAIFVVVLVLVMLLSYCGMLCMKK